ncbi:MAG: hypothetical protein LBP93_06155, partial [Treponema sp.]|nr:hypothetical protein [Treponema sp.]
MLKMIRVPPAILTRGGAYLAALIAGLVLMACAGGAPVKEGPPNFDEVRGKEWMLTELRAGSLVLRLDRQKLEAEGLGDVYTLRF